MIGRRGLAAFLIFLLIIILLLQILLIIRFNRLNERVNRLEKTLENSVPRKSHNDPESSATDDGDWLVWAFRVEPRTLNPVSAEADVYTTWITIPYIFEPLLVYDYDQAKLRPHLAQSCEISNDGLEVTFQLRQDAHFSDGAPVTADDVVFTFQTIVNSKIDAANVAGQYADVADVTKLDDRSVKFHLKQPHFKSLEKLSFCRTTGILPKHIYRFDNPQHFNKRISNPVGSGPYVFESWDVGRQLVLSRNENYWADQPKLKKIVYRFISNPVAAVQALRRHEVDIVIPEPEQFAELVADSAFTQEFYCLSYWTAATPFSYIGWNCTTEPFLDRRVRLAMTYIIDRKAIIDHLLEGIGREISGPFYIFSPAYDPNITPWPYDPDRAVQLLEQAGWTDTDNDGLRDNQGRPLTFRFMYPSSYALYERLARLLKDSAARIGVEVRLEPCEWSVFSTRLNNRQFGAYIAGWSPDAVEDSYKLFHSSQIADAGCNYVGFADSQVDALVEQARCALDDDKRNQIHRALHKILHDEQPYTFLFTRPTLRLIDRRFENVNIHKLGLDYLEWYVPLAKQRYR